MAKITDAITIRGIRIKNRIVLPPMVTFSFRGDDGHYYGRRHVAHYTARAEGGAGLVIVQATRVVGAVAGTGMWTAGSLAALKEIAANCRARGAAAMMQLSCGDTDINALSAADIAAMQADMRQAALTACALGFDGAEYHFAHGFTLCKFLDASYNKRTDRYGGAAVARASVLTELLPAIRANTRDNFILGVRMGEYLPASRDGVEIAQTFVAAGIDLLHVSFAMRPPAHAVPAGFPCSPTTWSAGKIKQAVSVPVIAVNEIRTADQIRYLIETGCADLAAVGRGMLADPAFARHVIAGQPVNACRGCGDRGGQCRWFTDHTQCPAGGKG
jgi:2,4-dienoyl-CoA reductase-like NADH-dependent reductase (Old Yellow Enzyme family)